MPSDGSLTARSCFARGAVSSSSFRFSYSTFDFSFEVSNIDFLALVLDFQGLGSVDEILRQSHRWSARSASGHLRHSVNSFSVHFCTADAKRARLDHVVIVDDWWMPQRIIEFCGHVGCDEDGVSGGWRTRAQGGC